MVINIKYSENRAISANCINMHTNIVASGNGCIKWCPINHNHCSCSTGDRSVNGNIVAADVNLTRMMNLKRR